MTNIFIQAFILTIALLVALLFGAAVLLGALSLLFTPVYVAEKGATRPLLETSQPASPYDHHNPGAASSQS